MLDYRIHYAQLVIEDRLRPKRITEPVRPGARIHRRESARPVSAPSRS